SPRRSLAVNALTTRSNSSTRCIFSVRSRMRVSVSVASTSSASTTSIAMSVPPKSSSIFSRLTRVGRSAGSWLFMSVSICALGSCAANRTVSATKKTTMGQGNRITNFASALCFFMATSLEQEPELEVTGAQEPVDPIESGSGWTGVDLAADGGEHAVGQAIFDFWIEQPFERGDVEHPRGRDRERVVQRQPLDARGERVRVPGDLGEQDLVVASKLGVDALLDERTERLVLHRLQVA